MLDGADADRLLENLPSGFVAVVIADCGNLTLFAEIQGLPGCTGAVMTADLVDKETAVFHFLVGLGNESLAAEAAELALAGKPEYGDQRLALDALLEKLR